VSAVAVVMQAARAEGALGPDRPGVSITMVGCDPVLAGEAQRIATVELRATLVNAPPDPSVTRVTAVCQGASAALEVRDPMTGKSLQRTVALTETAPNARARLLALAVAELVAASWSELENNPQPRAPPAEPLAPYAAREAARAAVAGRSVELAAVVDLHFLASGDGLAGGGARAAFWLSPIAFVRVDVLANYAELGRTTGSVAVVMPSASVAIGVAGWLGARLRPAASAGIRSGYVWMNGVASSTAAMGSRQQGAWIGPELSVQLTAWPRARVHPVLGVAAGAHLVGVRGTVGDDRDVEAIGFWGGLSVAVTLR
jgi:hypothetical protein